MAAAARRNRSAHGFSTLEILLATALFLTVGGVAIPPLRYATDSLRAAAAARYVSTRLHRTRMEAVARSTDVAIRFTVLSSGYSYAVFVDGNRNGVLARDIDRGVDRRLGSVERLSDNFPGVDFGTLPDLPAVDAGGTPPGSNPIRLGASGSATFSPLGTSSTGTLYLKSSGGQQYAVRIYGDTGKTRLLKFEAVTRSWKPV